MTTVSLNVGSGVRLTKPAKLCMCSQNHYKHNEHGCARPWFRTTQPLGERRYEDWITSTTISDISHRKKPSSLTPCSNPTETPHIIYAGSKVSMNELKILDQISQARKPDQPMISLSHRMYNLSQQAHDVVMTLY